MMVGSPRKRKYPEMQTVPVILPETSDMLVDAGKPRSRSYVDEKGDLVYGKTRRKKRAKRRTEPVSWGDVDPNDETPVKEASPDGAIGGRLAPIAAKVLMKIRSTDGAF